jgi:hypothetical protein
VKLDRREFIQIGAAGAFAASGACADSSAPAPSTGARAALTSAEPSLQIEFEGLYLIEQKGTSMVVHLIDGPAVGLPAHTAQMKALASTIDKTKTAKPDNAHVIPAGGSEDFWLWDLNGVTVTGPASSIGASDLIADQSSLQDGLEMPADEAGWHSLARVPDLRVLCGATKIAKYDALSSSITLTHGRLSVLPPAAEVGARTVWVFKDMSGKTLMRRALTDRVMYECAMNGAAATVQVGSQPVVFTPGAIARVSLYNVAPRPMPCGNPCNPKMSDFAAFTKVVDAQFVPVITAAAPFPPVSNGQAAADYCPGARI